MKQDMVIAQLNKRFPDLEGKSVTPHERRIFLEVPAEIFMDVIKYAALDLEFEHLCTITGLDSYEFYEFIYHISNDDGIVLNLKVRASKDPAIIPSVLPIYNGAIFYERELEGLLGVKVEGLPEGRQYPLPDEWPEGQYPLRKDWTAEMLPKI